MRRITASLKRRLEVKVAETLAEYSEFRKNLAENASLGVSIKDGLVEENIWEQKIKSLKEPLKRSKTITPFMQNEKVDFGTRLTLLYPSGRSQDLIIDGANYTDDDLLIISYNSKIGSKLIGRKVGDTIEIDKREVKIEKIEYPW